VPAAPRGSHHPALIVGLTAEARIARVAGWPIGIGGGGSAGAMVAAETMLRSGASGLVSLGLAGGLAPDLPAGTVVIPSMVRIRDDLLAVDLALAARLGGADGRSILGHDTIVVTAVEKQRLHAATGAVAVDMESGAVALVAQAHRVPFAVLRVICDPAARTLPPAALVALDQGGAIGLCGVIGSLLRRPAQFPALMRLAADAATARRTLRDRVARIAAG
jgi:adenosylhomocysteine nucleosidase